MPSVPPRTHLVAGTLEPFFLGTLCVGRLRCGRPQRTSSHVSASHRTVASCEWEGLPLMVASAFGR